MDRPAARGRAGRGSAGAGGTGAYPGAHRWRLAAPGQHGAAPLPGQHPVPGDHGGHRHPGDRYRYRLAGGDVSLPGATTVRVGAAAAAGRADLCDRLRLYRLPAVLGPPPGVAARPVRVGLRGLLVPRGALAGRGGNADQPGALPLRLHARTCLLHGAVGVHAGCGAHLGPRPLAAVLERGDSSLAPGTGGRRITGPDGNAERVRRGTVLRRGHLHHRHLPHLVWPRRAGRRRPARRLPADLRDRPGGAGALVAGQAALLPHLQPLSTAAGVPPRRLGLGRRLPGLPAADPGRLPDPQRHPRRAGHPAG